MNKRATLIAFFVAAVGALSPHFASAQATPEAGSPRVGFRLLHSFSRPEGYGLYGGLVQASDGNFYGVTTYGGGFRDLGTVFRLRPGGGVVTVHKFSGMDGAYPSGGLIQARDGNLYGTTSGGGLFGRGTTFRITPDGQLTTLFAFRTDGPEGASPLATLLEAIDGNLYGTTGYGGLHGWGTVFRMSLDGTVTPVYSFDVLEPHSVMFPLIQAGDGQLYGTSNYGGIDDAGTVFRMTLDGTLTIMKIFSATGLDGFGPAGGLLEGMDGKLYGTAFDGGSFGAGTAFTITTEGAFTLLHSFRQAGKVGYYPGGTLVQGTDGNLYGGTSSGGAFGAGTVFRMTLDGSVADLHAFDFSDGYDEKTLVRSADGRLYGTAVYGGVGGVQSGGGTLFALGEKPVLAPVRRWHDR